MNGTKPTPSPYVGTRPFGKNEGNLFFGRERESLDLLSLVISERLVLFYAQSGAGKSSLINTKLITGLMEEGEFEPLPVGRVGGSESVLDVDNIYVYHLINSLLRHDVRRDALSSSTLTQFLKGLDRDRDTFLKKVLIIDQFEELFSTHQEAWEKREGFFRQLARAMQEIPHLWVVLVMREDYIAYLDPYAHLLPGKLRVRYYMQRLDRDAALQAIKMPVAKLRPYAEGVAERLVENLAGIKVQKPNGEVETRAGQFVESVQLQVVCHNIWEHPSEGNQITQNDLDSVGDVDQALERYYDQRVSTVATENNLPEREIREWFEKELITSGRMRNMVLHGKKHSSGLDNDAIRALQGNLVRSEIRAGQIWYELSHDRLIEPVLKSNEKWFSAHLNFFQQQAALWNERGRSEGLLLRRAELREAEAWAEANKDQLTENEEVFLGACREAREEARGKALANKRIRNALRTSRLIAGVAIILLFVLVLLGIQSYQNQRTTQLQVLLGAASQADDEYTAALLGYQALINYGDHGEAEHALGNIFQPLEKQDSIEVPFIASELQSEVTSVTISPDGRILASGDSNGTVMLWDPGNYEMVGELRTYTNITSIAFSPNGNILAAPSYTSIALFDVSNPTTLSQIFGIEGHSDYVKSVTFSPDGKYLVSGSNDFTARVWEVVTGKEVARLTHDNWVNSVAFSPDGKYVVSGSNDFTARVWEALTGKEVARLTHDNWVTSVAFSPDGKYVVSGSNDFTARVWEAATGREIARPTHDDWVTSVAFSPDGRYVVSGSGDSTARVWEAATGKEVARLTHDGFVISVAFSPNGKELVSGSPSGAILWDVSSVDKPLQLARLTKSVANVNGVNFMSLNSDGKTLAAIDRKGAIIRSDIEKGDVTFVPLDIDDNPGFMLVAFSLNGKYLVTGSNDFTARVWETATGREIARLTHDNPVNSVAFSPDDKYVASGSGNTARVWEAATGKEIARLTHDNLVNSVAFSPDGKYVASGSGDNTARVWEATTGKEIARLTHDNWVTSVSFSPDGTRIVTAFVESVGNTSNGIVTVWDLNTRQPILAISNGEAKPLNYTLGGLNSLGNQRNQPEGTGNTQTNLTGVEVADVEFSPEGLFILYKNGVIDHWSIWPSRSELRRAAEGVCDRCELTYAQRIEYELYTVPMQVFNYQGYIVVTINLLIYGLFGSLLYRHIFAKPPDHRSAQGFSWNKFLRACAYGGVLFLLSFLSGGLIGLLEQIYHYPDASRYSDNVFVWLLGFPLPLSLLTGVAYSHYTRLQTGKRSTIKRSLIGMLAGALGGLLGSLFGFVLLVFATTRDLASLSSAASELLWYVLVCTGGAGLGSFMGALIYIFWLYPWSERRRLQQQQEEDF